MPQALLWGLQKKRRGKRWRFWEIVGPVFAKCNLESSPSLSTWSTCNRNKPRSQNNHKSQYDAVSDLMHNWVAQRPDFKSALSVVKMVLNTQCYQYLWLTMCFHAKQSKETLKKSKSLILQCKFGSRAQKWPKNAQKTDHSIAIFSNFWIGMVYFGYHLVNPHVQTVQNMYGKGG